MAEICAIQGRLPFEVWDSTTWPDYLALQDFWRQWPPVIVTSAILAGLSPAQRKTTDPAAGELTEDDVSVLLSLAGQNAPIP